MKILITPEWGPTLESSMSTKMGPAVGHRGHWFDH